MNKRIQQNTLVLISSFILISIVITQIGHSQQQFDQVIIPRPFTIAVDDMGWNDGSSLGISGGPWRAGLRRYFDVRDYEAVVNLGKAVGMRLQCAFILSEMDREGIVSEYPTATQAGINYDNSMFDDDVQIEVMQYVKNNAAYLEFGLHGTGHEHWENGVRTRAEWYDLENDKPRAEEDSKDRITLFKRIMAQYGWTEENGQSFPESFVPCAYGYYWNPEGNFSTGKLLFENGVKYGNTDFRYILELDPPLDFGGGFDHGLLMIQRDNYGNEWFDLAVLPKVPIDSFKTDIIETHWPNLLAQDDFLQDGVTNQWIEFFRNIQARPDRYLAKNTEQFSSQWLYNRYAVLHFIEPGRVQIDNIRMPDEAYSSELLGNIVVAIQLPQGKHISESKINGQYLPAILEDGEYAYLYLPPLKQQKYELTYEVGKELLPFVVNHTGTYNIYRLDKLNSHVELEIEMYGTQNIELRIEEAPNSVVSNNPHLHINSWEYAEKTNMLNLIVSGRDMQGESGTIVIRLK